jgi:hypothetical protein
MNGYFKAKKEHIAYLVTEEQGKFIRKLRWKNMVSKLF